MLKAPELSQEHTPQEAPQIQALPCIHEVGCRRPEPAAAGCVPTTFRALFLRGSRGG